MSNLILLSGGLDSALCLARYGAELAVGFDYGQPHAVELEHAERIAAKANVPFRRVSVPEMPKTDEVVFAGRNAVLIAHAVAIAHAEGIGNVVIGCNFSDAQRFADCRPPFIRSLNLAMMEGYGVRVWAPLLTTSKAQVVAEARERGITDTWTCYSPTPEGKQCGECYSCRGLLA